MYRLIWKCCRSATIADKFGRCITTQSGGVDVSAEVESALHCGKAVVALESTIVTHGMPYPHNLTTALEVEEICRRGGVVPATIAVIKGRLHVGMDRSQIEQLADPQTNKVKISRRDLPSALSQGLTGGTTTAGTMVAAHLSGIQIFATGGIGGVHRDGHITMDVSSDLKELGRTPITVVSAGIKSILDIGRTLEYLETEGVCVVAYNQTTDFPSFFSPTSGHSAPHCVRNAQEAANLIAARNALGLSSGILIGVPIPHQDAPDGRIVQDAIHIATIEAKEKGIMGKDLTPFVLERVNQITEGASLRANIELIRNNAKVASEISLTLSRTKNAQQLSNDDKTADPLTVGKPSQRTRSSSHQQDRPVVIGGTNVDVIVTPHEKMKMNGSTVKGQVLTTFGGVARNVADCLMRLGQQVLFISAVGDDFYGHFVFQDNPQLHESGTDRLKGESTAVCSIILDDTRECVAVVADMKIHQLITPQTIARHEKDVTRAPIVVMDGNIPIETMKCIFDTCQQTGVPVWFEPTDVSQTVKMFGRCEEMWKTICYASPNFNELRAMHSAAFGPPSSQVIDGESMDDVDGLLKKCVVLADPFMEHIQTLVITLGHHGVLLVTTADRDRPFPLRGQRTSKREKLHATYFPLIRRQERVVSVSGAGDCLAGAVIGAVLRRETPERCVRAGLRAAQMSILSHESVPATVDRSSIYAEADDIQTWRPVPIDSL